jgi:hypothetical protein
LQAARLEMLRGGVGVRALASESAVVGGASADEEPTESEARRAFDKWLVWGIALLAIVLPAFFLVVISSMGSDSLNLTDFRTAAGRGEFLIPDAFLLVECCRRLIREVSSEHVFWKCIKSATVFLAAMLAVLCLVASVVLEIHDNNETARSAIHVTLWCLVFGVLAGTCAVAAKDGDR